MKKFFAMLLVVTMIASMATVVSAADTTTLTTTVPAATYTLNIPADQEVPFGATEFSIGNVTVSNTAGFAEEKNLVITVTYDSFECENTSTVIPYVLCRKLPAGAGATSELPSGSNFRFWGKNDGTTYEQASVRKVGGAETHYFIEGFYLKMTSEDWGKALAGEYTSTITFTAEVVAEDF
ncbi:MAG: hypothetical protein IJN53_03655 [Oscillospiraceae bacterium]|nr:hypothetical protein [Oscillospiraceae bacterium]